MKRCEGFNCIKKESCLNYLEKDWARHGLLAYRAGLFHIQQGNNHLTARIVTQFKKSAQQRHGHHQNH